MIEIPSFRSAILPKCMRDDVRSKATPYSQRLRTSVSPRCKLADPPRFHPLFYFGNKGHAVLSRTERGLRIRAYRIADPFVGKSLEQLSIVGSELPVEVRPSCR
jgi:hypothetical protein